MVKGLGVQNVARVDRDGIVSVSRCLETRGRGVRRGRKRSDESRGGGGFKNGKETRKCIAAIIFTLEPLVGRSRVVRETIRNILFFLNASVMLLRRIRLSAPLGFRYQSRGP